MCFTKALGASLMHSLATGNHKAFSYIEKKKANEKKNTVKYGRHQKSARYKQASIRGSSRHPSNRTRVTRSPTLFFLIVWEMRANKRQPNKRRKTKLRAHTLVVLGEAYTTIWVRLGEWRQLLFASFDVACWGDDARTTGVEAAATKQGKYMRKGVKK